MLQFLKDKSILITGGTGSFGKNFTKFLLKNSEAKRIAVLSRDEFKQFEMQKELTDPRLRFFIGDVRDKDRLQRAFKDVDIVVHAAALKHVPILEYNPYEAVKTNVLGTQNVIDAAIDQGVKKVLLVSTDKAVQPINLYGSTKLCAEKLLVAGNFYSPGKTRFSVVRYGNVIGSRGSLVETLLKEENVEKVTLTDPAMTRFWLKLEESFNLVSFALEQMEGGETFVPKIPSMKIVDLFESLVPQAEVKVTGLRPGEKMHEVLLTEQESERAVETDKYFVVLPEFKFSNDTNYEKYSAMGKRLHQGFRYASDTNTEWVSKETFKEMVDDLKVNPAT